jgi:phytoene dehydrogenase-like protein
MIRTVDAVVIGGGHHGLVAAAMLADAGWEVCLLEAADTVGGAVRSAELFPGYVSDLFSSFYPLAAVSPVLQALELERYGLRWTHAPAVLAHPLGPDSEQAAVLHREPADTAAALEARDPGDGEAWLRLYQDWQRVRGPLLASLFSPFPPVRGPLALLRALGTGDALRLARFLALPVRRMGQELFRGEPARLLLAGNAMHADVPGDAPGSGVFGWLLAMLGQEVGFPVPVGGAGKLAAALRARAEAAGAEVRTGTPVERVLVRGGRAIGVRTAGGEQLQVRRAVLADVAAPFLYGSLLPPEAVPAKLRADLAQFEWDVPTVKLNWALSGPIPWRAAAARGAGTVHVGRDDAGIVRWTADLATGVLPRQPFLLVGQMTTADASRSPAGTESAWAYTHLPRGRYDDGSAETLAERAEEVLEAHAPGFGTLVTDRSLQRPTDLQEANQNLMHGAVNGGTAQLFQQLVFRPTPGLGRCETVVENLYLASAAAHPGGAVHGACGALAARAALGEHGRLGAVRRRVTGRLLAGLYRERPSAR